MLGNWDWLSFVLGIFGGGAFTLVSIQIRKKDVKSSSGGNAVDQSNVRARGDVVGRDKK